MRAALSVVGVLLAVSVNTASAKCSPAEQVCGELCCCVTCTCLEGPFRCEDMWGKPTDPVGRFDDERFASREWTENLMREHQERHRQWIEEHEQRRRERREARVARGEPEEEHMISEDEKGMRELRRFDRKKWTEHMPGVEDMDDIMAQGPEGLQARLEELKHRRAKVKRRHRKGGEDEEDEEAARSEL